jgi:hypothetical protein
MYPQYNKMILKKNLKIKLLVPQKKNNRRPDIAQWYSVLNMTRTSVQSPTSKIKTIKNLMCRAGGSGSSSRCLPSKCEALSSNPSTTKKKSHWLGSLNTHRHIN